MTDERRNSSNAAVAIVVIIAVLGLVGFVGFVGLAGTGVFLYLKAKHDHERAIYEAQFRLEQAQQDLGSVEHLRIPEGQIKPLEPLPR